MRIVLDTARCQGHGRCYDLAPGLFDADDEGRAVVLPPGGEVAAADEAIAARAVRTCPEGALAVEGPAGG